MKQKLIYKQLIYFLIVLSSLVMSFHSFIMDSA